MVRLLPSLLLALVLACAPGIETGSAQARSSGGYSRPSVSFSSRSYSRPSFGTSYGIGAPRIGSGGYALPARRPSIGYRSAPTSGGDGAISQRYSGQAFRDYRPGGARAPGGYAGVEERRPSVFGSGSGDYRYGYARPQPWVPVYAPSAYGWAQRGSRFGLWDGLLLWSLLHSLSAPGHARFFYNNQNTPGYQEWRSEADRAAENDPALRARLADLDQRMAQLRGQPRDPGAPPPAQRPVGGWSTTSIIVVGLLVAAFAILWYWRRRLGRRDAAPAIPTALHGSARTRFRVGMTFPVDPTPFILARGATKVTPIAGGGMISVEAIGVVMDGPVPLHRLDPAQGMIGWPQFQTKDGTMYDRVWAPGGARIEPHALTETIEDVQGKATRRLEAMLYAAPTGAAPPAPQREYILDSATEQGDRAWVDIDAGIDINPAALSLPSVALA
ncbi:MAG: DUF2491 family protein [Thiohalocapsa sp.]